MPRSNLVLLVLLAGLWGCAGSPGRATLGDPEQPYPTERAVTVGDIVHMPSGHFVTEAQMLAVATDARVVYVGETHDNPASHRLELTLLKAMAERYPGEVAFGMEMFVPSQQATLDRWVAGELDERAFLEEAAWWHNWSSDWALYRDLLLFARDHQVPVIGLNAEDAVVKALVRSPVAELEESLRAQVPELDLRDPYQRAMVEAVYGGHSHGGSGGESGFVRVQTLWDETMASNVASYLGREENRDMRMVVVAGGNHVRNGFGIPRRVFRRLPVSYVLVGSEEIEMSEKKAQYMKESGLTMEVTSPSYPMVAYDFAVYMAYEETPGKPATLGALLEEVDGKVTITGVFPESAAAKGGLVKGDVVVSAGGNPVGKNFDLVYEIKTRYVDDPIQIVVQRDGAELSLDIQLIAMPMGKHGG